MTEIHETNLPGVGIRHDFLTKSGDRLGVISHHTGRKDLLIYDKEDPDACRVTVRLQDEDAHVMAELMGAVHVTRSLTNLQQSIEGLAIDWLPIHPSWACAGHSIAEMMVRTHTGVSIVAVIRGDKTTPSPTPEFKLLSGDMVVVVGTAEGIQKAADLLQKNEL